MTSGCFAANGAWLVCATIAQNLLRAAGTMTSRTCGKARAATLRRQIINVPAQLAHPAPEPPRTSRTETGRSLTTRPTARSPDTRKTITQTESVDPG
jgi:hypothetical protein